MAVEQVLGLDVGTVRTGIARVSLMAKIPEPLKTFPTSELNEAINELISQYNIDAVVVGLPRSLQGDDTAQTAWVRDWVEESKSFIKLPIYWQDEALTSKVAESQLRAKKNLPGDKDSLAAAVLLQDFANSEQHNWSRA